MQVQSASTRRTRLAAAVLASALAWLAGCVTDVVIRAPMAPASRGKNALSAIDPLAIRLLPVVGPGSEDPVGRRDGVFLQGPGEILLTEPATLVIERLIAEELRRAGHRLVEGRADVLLGIEIRDLSIRGEASEGFGWDLIGILRLAARVELTPGGDDYFEYVYEAERRGRTVSQPGVGALEDILAETLDDGLQLLAGDPGLAAGLERMAEVQRVRGGAPGPE